MPDEVLVQALTSSVDSEYQVLESEDDRLVEYWAGGNSKKRGTTHVQAFAGAIAGGG